MKIEMIAHYSYTSNSKIYMKFDLKLEGHHQMEV